MTLPRLFVAAALVLAAAPTAAEPATPWTKDGAAALRLIDAGEAPGGGRLAGVVIKLEPGWKTYWRQPGDSGVPPQFDFSQSTNVAEATVAYPLPERLADESGVTNVYHGEVLLPVTVRPKDPSAPMMLVMVASYGVCDEVCVPARSEATLELGADGFYPGPAAAALRRAADKVPIPTPLGAAEAGLSLGPVRRVAGAAGKTAVEVDVAAPDGPTLLFAETGDGDYVKAPEAAGPASGGKARFRIPFDRALPASGLRLTLASGGHAIETRVPLDAIAAAP